MIFEIVSFPIYFDSNIGLLSIAPYKVIALLTFATAIVVALSRFSRRWL